MRVWTAVLIIPLLIPVACNQPEQRKPRQAILILLDTARADSFSCYGYHRKTTPNLDRLARQGAVFLNHFSQGTHTLREIPNIFFSRYFFRPLFPGNPDIPFYNPRDLIRVNDAESISLPQAFAEAGYRTCIISAHAWIKPETPFAKEFQEIHDLSTKLTYPKELAYPSAEQVVNFAQRWLRAHQDEDFFLYLHFMDLHFPHFLGEDAELFLKEEGASLERPERFGANGWPRGTSKPLTSEERSYLNAIYDGNMRFTDRQLGRLFSSLSDLFENTLIAVIADHGEALLEVSDRFGHGGPWYDAVGHVPFIVFYPPKLKPSRNDFLTENVDVMPTLLGLMQVPLRQNKKTDGIDLTKVLSGEIAPREHAVMLRGVRDRRYKYVFGSDTEAHLAGDETESGKLYDLQEDPDETRDIHYANPAVVAELMDAYRNRIRIPYKRFEAAIRDVQPTRRFAIAAKVFHFGLPETDRDEVPDLNERGWEEFDKRQRRQSYVMAKAKALPLDIVFPLPNGIYSVAVSASGAGKIRLLPEKRDIPLRTSELFSPEEIVKSRSERISLGPVRITGEKFHVTLFSDAEYALLVRYFEFVPLETDGKEVPEMDEKTREQLKALGYIQ